MKPTLKCRNIRQHHASGDLTRPAYRKIHNIRRHLAGVPMLALTATAAAKVDALTACSLVMHAQPVELSALVLDAVQCSGTPGHTTG